MDPEPGRGFKTAVSLQSLQEGTEIILDTENADISSEEDDYFSEESFRNFKKELEKICNSDDCEDSNVDLTSYEQLSTKMEPLTEDGCVRKLVLKPGQGPVIPPKSLVVFHYNAYLEKQTVPFDSTYQRNSPFRFLLGDGKVVLGLELGIATMTKGEVSSFLVHPEYAYGPMGCPPRVPPKATVFYEVEVLHFIDSADALEFEQMSEEQQRRAPFEKILSACKAEHQLGNGLFQKKIFSSAASRYRKAVRRLEEVSVADEEEDNKRLSLLLKLYMNLSVCYLKLKNAKKCRINALNVLKLDENRIKALFFLGKSYFLDCEYDEALKHFYRAQKLEPYNEEINREISITEKKYKQAHEIEKIFCKKMFGGESGSVSQFNEPQEFVDSIKDCVKSFKESSENEYCFSSGFTPSQVDDIKLIASLNDVQFIEKIYNGTKISKLCKYLS